MYSYNASAHSPSGSGSGTLGRGGGGGGEGVLGACDTVELVLFGGGGKADVLRGKADGVGGATWGGVADVLAVELRKDENIAFPDETSTSPNFCAKWIKRPIDVLQVAHLLCCQFIDRRLVFLRAGGTTRGRTGQWRA